MKKVTVHVGAHKTASTTIQNFISLNKSIVDDNVFLCHRENEIGKKLKHSLFESIRKNDFMFFKEYLTFIKTQALNRKCDRILFTDEALLGFHIGQFSENDFYPYASDMAFAFSEVFDCEVEFLLVTRDRFSWLLSLYNQSKKECDYKGSLESFMVNIDLQSVSWIKLSDELSKHGATISIFDISKLESQDGVYNFLAENILSDYNFKVPPTKNQSLGENALSFISENIYRCKGDMKKKQKLINFAREFYIDNDRKVTYTENLERNVKRLLG